MLGLFEALIPFIIMIAVMYFLLIRPQKKQQDETQKMLDNLQPGESVITIGGLHGVIDEIDEQAGTVVLDCEGIYLVVERRAIARVAPPVVKTTTDVSANAEDLGTNTPVSENDDERLED